MIYLLMPEIVYQLIGSLSNYLQGFIHPSWCRISSINRIFIILLRVSWREFLSNHWKFMLRTSLDFHHFRIFFDAPVSIAGLSTSQAYL